MGALVGARFVSLVDGVCTYEYEAREDHYNPGGMLHGGALFSVMDSSQGMLVYSIVTAPDLAVTGTATIRYLAPVRRGRIVVSTRVTGSDGRKLFVRSEASDERATMVAALDATWIVTRAPQDAPSKPS